jgi:hypothetical protein
MIAAMSYGGGVCGDEGGFVDGDGDFITDAVALLTTTVALANIVSSCGYDVG